MSAKQRRAPAGASSTSSSASKVGASASTSDTVATSDSSTGWFGQMVAGEPTHQGVEGGVSRPDTSVRKGLRGAIIDQGGAGIPFYNTFEDQEPSRDLKSGVAVKVLSQKEGWMQIEFREADRAATGWVDASYFSDQPGLGMDDSLDGKVMDDFIWKKFEGDQTTEDLAGDQVEQGALGNCFLIASMNAIGSANPDFLEESIRYNADKESYEVRFYEGTYGSPREVWVEVDAYLPTTKDGSHAYAGVGNGGTKWGPIIEKAYAKFKGGYHVLGEGGAGSVAMAEMTGSRSRSKSPSTMSEDEVIPYFQKAKEDGLAIYAGVRNSAEMESVSPLRGSGQGPFTATLPKTHDWNEVQYGTVKIHHPDREVRDVVDTGKDGDKQAALKGPDLDEGTVTYGKNQIELTYAKNVTDASDLVVDYEAQGVVLPSKMLIGNHAYSFVGVVEGDKLQFYNPWGSNQPKAITAAEFLENFDSLATNQVPKAKKADDS